MKLHSKFRKEFITQRMQHDVHDQINQHTLYHHCYHTYKHIQTIVYAFSPPGRDKVPIQLKLATTGPQNKTFLPKGVGLFIPSPVLF